MIYICCVLPTGRMTQGTVTVNGVQVASSTLPPSTHINILLHQESAVEQLLKAMGSLKQCLSLPRGAAPSKAGISHSQLALGVTQILLGFLSCVLGLFLYFGPRTELRAWGCAFWAGSVAMAAGASSIVHEKRQGKLLGHLSRLLTMAGIGTAMAAAVLGVRSLIWQTDASYITKFSSVCDVSRHVDLDPEFRTMDSSDYEDWREERCRMYMKMMMNLLLAFCALFTAACILKVIVASASLILSFQSMFRQRPFPLDEEDSEKKLLGGNSVPPSPVKEKIPVIL